MTNLTENSTIILTETKLGSATSEATEWTIGCYITYIQESDADGQLDIGVEEILDEDGDIIDYTPNKFFDLSLEDQLELCIERNEEANASSINCKKE